MRVLFSCDCDEKGKPSSKYRSIGCRQTSNEMSFVYQWKQAKRCELVWSAKAPQATLIDKKNAWTFVSIETRGRDEGRHLTSTKHKFAICVFQQWNTLSLLIRTRCGFFETHRKLHGHKFLLKPAWIWWHCKSCIMWSCMRLFPNQREVVNVVFKFFKAA